MSWVKRIATSMANATSVLRIDRSRFGDPGQIPEKSPIPTMETVAEVRASCPQASPLTRIPQNDMDAAAKPRAATSQNGIATVAAVFRWREGNNQDRTGTREVEGPPRL